ncbi:hypothetical protein FNF27_06834 [Cafeteria roenbergensis]|uniref:Band 7 domain-containing protein n=1 Tax=Cafeteria roenbergensis TaxID=33653 RepID=A0A5A8C403_CAFRO|nr:hypothetical protein FNF31_07589 [Cafeteria roenbergensis]KAA0149756.1 hypothetical protein FNF29_05767 [Cafeteria roenbergensis]KAA0160905.1 hypothetical protein FNF28_05252 [Cafeteria roenbergensis]KAA0169810.1 hypothetical protein FNF27_06834 [Cafeteria roenbergensis]|eukprot:KAA0149756.1 hypothetical protein FNF29_05767 [Cafeteria roenbergensis]
MSDSTTDAIIGVAATVAALIVISFILSKVFIIVNQGEAVIIERLGKFHRVLNPGLQCIIPLVDSPKQFVWRDDRLLADGSIHSDPVNVTRIDLREAVFKFPSQEVYTVDTVQMKVDAVMYFRIADVHKAVYQVDDLAGAVHNVAQAQLKDVFGSKTMSAALQGQKTVNEHLQRLFDKEFTSWGLEVYRIELLDLSPLSHSDTAVAMKEQMKAERKRRAEFIVAEGNKTATRLVAEGEKMCKTNIGVAEQEATRKRSEGAKTAKIEMAKAETTALESVAEEVETDGCSQTDYALFNLYNNFMRDGVAHVSNKVLYLPYDASAVTGLLHRLPAAFGRKQGVATGAAGAPGGADAAAAAAGDAALD